MRSWIGVALSSSAKKGFCEVLLMIWIGNLEILLQNDFDGMALRGDPMMESLLGANH
jgi:hypothetical protein